jgi:hypothetical protein
MMHIIEKHVVRCIIYGIMRSRRRRLEQRPAGWVNYAARGGYGVKELKEKY